jgi:two-component system chemotaxis sensor kinase CheA
MDPLVHLVRNAISHGIEPPAERTAAGKPPEGVIRLSAAAVGESVIVEVADDGRGVDVEAVAARARASGLDVPPAIDASTLLDLICAAGLSTREEADRASGRGVGMAVVKKTVQDLGGTLSVDTERGAGTRFVMQLPLTLSIVDALIATVSGQVFAVPQGSVNEVIEVPREAVRRLENNEVIVHRNAPLPLVRLSTVFGLDAPLRAREHVFVIGSGRHATGIVVDRIVGQREIVVRTIGDPLIKVNGVGGATELGDGRVVLILDVPGVVRAHQGRAVMPDAAGSSRGRGDA